MTRLVATSFGLLRRRADLRAALDAERILPLGGGTLADGYVGWGAKESGARAQRLSERSGKALHIVEDGFLSGHFGGRPTAAVSYIHDGRAAHYEGETDLEAAIRDGSPDRARVRAAMDALRRHRLTKYNDAPFVSLDELSLAQPFVLLIEQVEGDLSLAGDGPAAFEALWREARERFPNHRLIVRPHPAARGRGPLERVADGALIVRERCNPWPLLEGAAHVFTHSSHLGFEALMAGTPVTVHGCPFYAGWGLTDDRAAFPRRAERDLETVFHAAYIEHSRYLDLHDRQPTTLETTIESLVSLRDTQLAVPSGIVTAELSPWKRHAIAPFVTSLEGPPRHERTVAAARAMGRPIAVWGADVAPDANALRLEDGFVRSRGLGAALIPPLSLIRAQDARLPFDARGTNVVERALLDDPPGEADCTRALALVERIVGAGVTKYMLAGETAPLPATDRLKVLVVGQVEDDASIRFGSPEMKTNSALIATVRELYPDALIAYRDHPDVMKGLRKGEAERTHVDLDVDAHPITALLDWCDRVETITSGTGFEALLRGVPVGTHGWPFYAGWGLTDDRLAREPRGRVTLGALAAAALVRVPSYIHPTSRLPCTAERAVEALANPSRSKPPFRVPLGLAIGRAKHRLRQFALRLPRRVRRNSRAGPRPL